MLQRRGLFTLFSLLVAMSLPGQQVLAGAYIFADEVNGIDIITHPSPYTGIGGIVTVRVCIDPTSPNAAEMEYSVQNNIAVYNAMIPTHGNLKNGGSNNIPSGRLDFESVSLHEIGHCLGMAHVNAASESGLTGNDQDYTRATDGANDTWDLDPGSDGVVGSSDDIRGDDVNLYWFRTLNNDPFTIDTVIDSTTYSRDVADLPAGHSFPANPDRDVSTLLGYTKSEAVMQQLTYYDEAQRTLGHDDVATLRYAMSGLNERESGNGPGGNQAADNYDIVLEYGGISNVNCDISMKITNTASLAFCNVGGAWIDYPTHLRITDATIEFGNGFNWFFNTDNTAPTLNAIANQTLTEADVVVVNLSATDNEGHNLAYSTSGLPAFASLVDNGDGTADIIISPAIGDASINNVTVTVTDDGIPAMNAQQSFDIDVAVLDTDNDGVSDYDEINVYGTLPANPDSDGDLIGDGVEIGNGSDPLNDMSWPAFADGDLAPLNAPDGMINAADYLVSQRIVLGDIIPNAIQLSHGDLFPPGSPDGVINAQDLILQLKLVQP